MESLHQQVAKIAALLQQEGKEPSLALIKARLGTATMSPTLLQAYQAWRSGALSQDDPALQQSAKDSTGHSEQENMTQLRADLARIEAKLDFIIKKLEL